MLKPRPPLAPACHYPGETDSICLRFPVLYRWARSLLFRLLTGLHEGRLTILEGGEVRVFGGDTELTPKAAAIRVHHPRAYSAIVFGGSRGLGEAYMRGDWSSPDLTAAICLLIRSVQAWEKFFWLGKLTAPIMRLRQWRRRNSVAGSRRNITAHYDLGNDFYALFLDSTMTYSCGIFETPEASLEEAQLAKYERVCRQLDLGPGDHLLEIGCGWGGLAIHAARHYGCRVTATTISPAQFEFARHRIQEAGLAARITLLARDYRHLEGEFDKLASIEMIEAVGLEYLPQFFRVCSRCLKPQGLMLLQAITIGDEVFERYRRSLDFIRSHIFPGGCILSLHVLGEAARRTDLRLVHLEDLTHFYPPTLRRWRQNLAENLGSVRQQGFSEEFIRLWDFYLCYCEGGFLERYIGDMQLLYAKPGHRESVWPFAGKRAGRQENL